MVSVPGVDDRGGSVDLYDVDGSSGRDHQRFVVGAGRPFVAVDTDPAAQARQKQTLTTEELENLQAAARSEGERNSQARAADALERSVAALTISIRAALDTSHAEVELVRDEAARPAGLEIEQPLKGEDAKLYSFLGRLTDTGMQDARDDRYVAAFKIDTVYRRYDKTPMAQRQAFHVAYIARAVSVGRFTLPAASVEDMYAPAVRARTAMGDVTVNP